MMAVFPSADSATALLKRSSAAPAPTSLPPCWAHTPPERVYTHAAPASLLSRGPPTMAVFPSADIATDWPCSAPPTAPVPTSLPPCCVHTPPERVNAQAAPITLFSPGPPSPGPPMMAVFPSADIATEVPCSGYPTAPVRSEEHTSEL